MDIKTPHPPLLTIGEVAVRLNIKRRTAYEYLAPGGPLHHLRIELGPKTIRVHPDELEKFIKKGQSAHAFS